MQLWILVAIALPILQLASGQQHFTCPKKCQCFQDPVERDKIMHLTCKWNSIDSESLSHIRHYDVVRTLKIRCNPKSAPVVPPPRAFARLRFLDRLEIDKCQLPRLPPNLLDGLNFLYSLIIKNAGLEEVPQNAFTHLTNLMSLDLSGNKLRLEPRALSSLSNLLTLDLSNNSITYVSNVLTNSPKLKVVSFSNNEIDSLDFRRFPKSVTDLTMRNNKLKTIHSFAESAQNLQRLDLSGNNMEFIAASGSINQLPTNLNVLDLSENDIETIEEGSFKNMEKLSMVDLRNNNIHEITEASLEIKRTQFRVQLYMAGNPLKCNCENYWILQPQSKKSPVIADISNVTCHHILDSSRVVSLMDTHLMSGFLCKYDSNCLEGCHCCAQKHEGLCSCYRSCPVGCHCFGSAGATAHKLGQNVVTCHNVRVDRMQYVPDSVTELHLPESMWRDRGLDLLGTKDQLQLLNLSGNSIEFLNKTFMNQFPRLTLLDLSSNRLKTIKIDDLQELKVLRTLNIKNNEFTDFNEDSIQLLDRLNEISLSGNKNTFSCECDREQRTLFQRWLRKKPNQQKILDYKNITCYSVTYGTVPFYRMDDSEEDTLCPQKTTTPATTTKQPSGDETDDENEEEEEDEKETNEADKDMDTNEENNNDNARKRKLKDKTTKKKDKSNLGADEDERMVVDEVYDPYAVPTKIIDVITKISTSTRPVTTETEEDGEESDRILRKYAPNSKAIRSKAREHTTPSPRRDIDSHVLFSVLLIFLLVIVIALICAIASTIYYRLIRPDRYDVHKVRENSVPADEAIPLNNN